MFKKPRKPSYLIAGFLAALLALSPVTTYATVFYTGSGADGALSVSGTRTEDTTTGSENITSAAASGQKDVIVNSGATFAANDWVLIHQTSGTGVGNYEFAKVASINSNTLTMYSNLSLSYAATGAQVIDVGEYSSVTVPNTATWTASAWNGTKGGVLVAMISGNLTLESGGTITMAGKGHRLGTGGDTTAPTQGRQGEGSTGTGADATAANGSGGGGGRAQDSNNDAAGGGGGGHSAGGSTGGATGCSTSCTGGSGGDSLGDTATLTTAIPGGGGGEGTAHGGASDGGNGGGIIIFVVGGDATVNAGSLTANGSNGSNNAFCSNRCGGGGGGGGAIRFLLDGTVTLGSGIVTAANGAGGGNGGAGGTGRIATLDAATVSGTSGPAINETSTDTVTNTDPNAPAGPNAAVVVMIGSPF